MCFYPDIAEDASEVPRRDILVDDDDGVEQRREGKEEVGELPLEARVEDVRGDETDAEFGLRR